MPDFNQWLEWLKSNYLAYGYFILPLAAFLEYLFPVGYFFPGGTLILLGVLYSVDGQLFFPAVVGLVTLGSIVGNVADYWLGYKGLLRLLKASRFYPKIEAYLDKAHTFVEKYGRRAVFFSQFIGYLRPCVMLLAGTVRMPFRIFFLFQVPATLLWNIIFCGAGYLLAKSVSRIESIASGIGLFIGVIAGLGWLSYRFFLRRKA